MSTSVMNRLRDLERELARRMSESRKKDEYIARLEHRLDERDASVRHLRNEIDKFQQVVRPLTQHIMAMQMADDYLEHSAGCCNGRGGHHHGFVGPAASSFKGRPTRQAISAEPLRTTDPLPIVKVPKSTK
jgi:cGMP-dependent protein kinase